MRCVASALRTVLDETVRAVAPTRLACEGAQALKSYAARALRCASDQSARRALVLLLPITLIVGCSQKLTTWQLNSPVQAYSPSQALCRYQGKRIAIVPGNAFSGRAEDSEHSFHSTTALSYMTVSSRGELRYRVDDGPWIPIPGGTEIDPTAGAWWVAVFENMGFTVVDRTHVAAVLGEQDVRAVFSENASQVGRLVGADILAAISVHQSPSVYFASISGAWATLPTISQTFLVTFIAVADGTNLGSISGSQELWSFCGYARLEASGPFRLRLRV